MMAEAPPLLRPSAISGLVRLRARLRETPELSIHEACKLLAATYDGAGLNLNHARVLHDLIAPEIVDRQMLYQHAIRMVVTKTAPSWSVLLRSGREALLSVDAD